MKPHLLNLFVTGILLTGLLSNNAFASSHLPTLELHLGTINNDTSLDGADELVFGFVSTFAPESFPPYLRLSVDIWGWGTDLPNTEFTSCFFCSINDEVNVDVIAFGVGLVGIYPTESNFQFYAQIGFSYTRVDYELRGSVFGFPGTAAEDGDSGTAIQYGVGMIYKLGNNSMGVHARKFDIESSSEEFAISDIDVGGDYLGISVGWVF